VLVPGPFAHLPAASIDAIANSTGPQGRADPVELTRLRTLNTELATALSRAIEVIETLHRGIATDDWSGHSDAYDLATLHKAKTALAKTKAMG